MQSNKFNKKVIHTDAAPQAIGTYSQAVQVGELVFLSGQIPLDPQRMMLIEGGIDEQIHQVFKNLSAVAQAVEGSLNDIVKLNVFLVDLENFPRVNAIMAEYFAEPYPARVAIGIAALPRGAAVEMDAIMIVNR